MPGIYVEWNIKCMNFSVLCFVKHGTRVYTQSHRDVFGFLGWLDGSTSVSVNVQPDWVFVWLITSLKRIFQQKAVFGTGTFNKRLQSSLSFESVCRGPVPGFGLTRSLSRVGRLGWNKMEIYGVTCTKKQHLFGDFVRMLVVFLKYS